MFRRERFYRPVRLLDAIHKCRRERVTERVQSALFKTCAVENAVIPFAEVHRAGESSGFVADQRRVLAEVSLTAQFFDHGDCGRIQRYVALARCGFELADPHLRALVEVFESVAGNHFFRPALYVHDAVREIGSIQAVKQKPQ